MFEASQPKSIRNMKKIANLSRTPQPLWSSTPRSIPGPIPHPGNEATPVCGEAQQQFMCLRRQQASAWGPGNHLRLEALHHIPGPLPPSWQRGRADARPRRSNSCPCGSSSHLHGAPGTTRASSPDHHIPGPPSPILATRPPLWAAEAQQQFMPLLHCPEVPPPRPATQP